MASVSVAAGCGVLLGPPVWDGLGAAHRPAGHPAGTAEPTRAPGEPWQAALPRLWWEPRRGSLADDQAWLSDMHVAALRALGAETLFELTGDGDDVKILYAGDVGTQRLAFVGFRAFPVTGGEGVTMFAWFRGRRGATAEELTSHVTFESAEAISVVLEDHAPGAPRSDASCRLVLITIARRTWTIETSLTADGSGDDRSRVWQRQGAGGVAVVDLPPAVAPGDVAVRFTAGGTVVGSGAPEYDEWTRNPGCPRP